MAQKCVHKGCEKLYTDPDEECTYHPGPPVFHEGQKGWKCCKPRVLTFEEFMTIPPCTTGTHSTTDLPPAIEPTNSTPADSATAALAAKLDALVTSTPPPTRAPVVASSSTPAGQVAVEPESEDDDPAIEIPDGKDCRRRGCGVKYKKGGVNEGEGNQCTHHPGAPIFHEGSKGYSCCKRRVLEFDQFMRIEGCETKDKHLFVGSGKKKGSETGAGGEEVLETVRTDFYQTLDCVNVSFFLKKTVKEKSKIEFTSSTIELDLVTGDSPPKRYTASIPLFGAIDPVQCSCKVMTTKLEMRLTKTDGASWPVLRSDQATTGEILQIGRAGLM